MINIICSRLVQDDLIEIIKKKCAACWSCSHVCITMHGSKNVKFTVLVLCPAVFTFIHTADAGYTLYNTTGTQHVCSTHLRSAAPEHMLIMDCQTFFVLL